jgi:hypothetical protein
MSFYLLAKIPKMYICLAYLHLKIAKCANLTIVNFSQKFNMGTVYPMKQCSGPRCPISQRIGAENPTRMRDVLFFVGVLFFKGTVRHTNRGHND